MTSTQAPLVFSPTPTPDSQAPKEIPQGASLIPLNGSPAFDLSSSSSYSTYYAQKAFDGDSYSSRWETDLLLYNSTGDFQNEASCSYCSTLKNMWSYDFPTFEQTSVSGEWIEIKFAAPVRIQGYAITALPDVAPASWKLMAGNPQNWGSFWLGMHSAQNENRWSIAKDQTIYFEIPEQLQGFEITVLRLVVSKTSGSKFVGINEIVFNGQSTGSSTFLVSYILC